MAIAYTIVLIIATLVNLSGVPSLGSSFDDKIYHFVAYAGLSILWTTYYKPNKKPNTLRVVFVVTILFGVMLEMVQHQLNPNRTYDTLDMFANCLGVIVGTLIASRIDIIKLK